MTACASRATAAGKDVPLEDAVAALKAAGALRVLER